jgi:hypothetical protein
VSDADAQQTDDQQPQQQPDEPPPQQQPEQQQLRPVGKRLGAVLSPRGEQQQQQQPGGSSSEEADTAASPLREAPPPAADAAAAGRTEPATPGGAAATAAAARRAPTPTSTAGRRAAAAAAAAAAAEGEDYAETPDHSSVTSGGPRVLVDVESTGGSSSSGSVSPGDGAESDAESDGSVISTGDAGDAAGAGRRRRGRRGERAHRPGGAAASAEGEPAIGNGEELQQRLEDLLEEFQQTHKQLLQQEAEGAAAAGLGSEDGGSEAAPQAIEGGGGGGSGDEGGEAAGDEQAGARVLASAGSIVEGFKGLSVQDTREAAAEDGQAGEGSSAGGPAAIEEASTSAAAAPAAAAAEPSKRAQPDFKHQPSRLSRVLSAATGAVSAVAVGGAADAAAAAADDEVTSSSVALPVPAAELRPGGIGASVVRANLRKDASRSAASRSWWPQLSSARGAQPRPPWWGAGAPQHRLQRWFGVDHFVLLQPRSYSKRLLDAAEAATLASASALALTNSRVTWPLFLPVHDALRDAYTGNAQVGACSVQFSTDSTHVSRPPRRLREADEQLAIFAEQLGPCCPAAAAACLAARSDAAAAPGGGGFGGRAGTSAAAAVIARGGQYAVDLTVRYVYKLPEPRLLGGGYDSASPMSEVRRFRGLRVVTDNCLGLCLLFVRYLGTIRNQPPFCQNCKSQSTSAGHRRPLCLGLGLELPLVHLGARGRPNRTARA